jgi:alkyldihydroxyacetonephosphate synthase
MIDLMRLRENIVENVPDVVVYPRDRNEITKIVSLCNDKAIPLYVRGGGSSVTRGTECLKGGVSLDMTVHMTKILKLDETNHTVTVEPGIMGPALEGSLNNAVNELHASRNYTCGHLPQSFEYSSVGGWVVTRGAGQNSTYYGKIEHLVVCQEYVTPAGNIRTKEHPAFATGPSIDQLMIGSEGSYGILISVTLKIFRYMPDNTRCFSYIFKTWGDAIAATREVLQSQIGLPSVFRLSDPEETDVVMKLYGVEGTPIDWLLKVKGYKPGNRCLLLGTADGDRDYASLVARKIRKIVKTHGAMSSTGYVAKKWEHGRYTDPYLRDDLHDYGVIVDTLECALNWKQLDTVYGSVREFCKSRPNTICMSHISHFYPQGINLYFIFIGKMDRKEYVEYQKGILGAIQESGAAMSHHHGIGKMFAPWLAGSIGMNELNVFKALKKHFDPKNIMNPGGTLALDMNENEMIFPRT